jgi:hypothetical protein
MGKECLFATLGMYPGHLGIWFMQPIVGGSTITVSKPATPGPDPRYGGGHIASGWLLCITSMSLFS